MKNGPTRSLSVQRRRVLPRKAPTPKQISVLAAQCHSSRIVGPSTSGAGGQFGKSSISRKPPQVHRVVRIQRVKSQSTKHGPLCKTPTTPGAPGVPIRKFQHRRKRRFFPLFSNLAPRRNIDRRLGTIVRRPHQANSRLRKISKSSAVTIKPFSRKLPPRKVYEVKVIPTDAHRAEAAKQSANKI